MTTAERPTTMCEAFQRTAAIDPDAFALRTPGGTQTLTWREYADQVREVAAGPAGLRVRRGDTVSPMMSNRVEFYLSEVGAQHVGATWFSMYYTLEGQHVERILGSGTPIEHIACIDGNPAGTMTLDDLYAAAPADFHAKYAAEIEELYSDEPGDQVHQPAVAAAAQPA